jgi:AmiR/NasT family two-component response regulator
MTAAPGNGSSERALRVLAADEDRAALESTAQVLRGLGHEVTSYAIGVGEAAQQIARDEPDLAVVVLHDDDEHALDLIRELSEYASGPVIALLEGEDAGFASAAAEGGIDACAWPVTPDAVQAAIEVAIRRHAERRALAEEVEQLQGALERRAVIERAKGIIMERHGIGDREAFDLLRDQARRTSRPVVAVAQGVVDGHALLPRDA